MRTRHPRHLRRVLLGAVGVVAVIVIGLFAGASVFGGSETTPALRTFWGVPAAPAEAPAFSPAAARAKPDRWTSIVARARSRSVLIYASPHARRPYRRLRARTVGGRPLPLVFLITSRRLGWLRAYLPSRPNLSTGWIRARAVSVARDDYRVRVNLRRHRLTVWSGSHVIAREPIATGRALSPTPTGRYYITDVLRPPDPKGFYGPYAFGLSAHSPVYTTFAGGDGQVGIHGTNDPSVLGTDVSHGCIRIANRAITRLVKLLPLGTPVFIER